jgi:hypothetical protein
MARGILVQSAMRSPFIVEGRKLAKDPAQVGLPKHDHVVEAFPPDRADQSLRVPVLPRRACGNRACRGCPRRVVDRRGVPAPIGMAKGLISLAPEGSTSALIHTQGGAARHAAAEPILHGGFLDTRRGRDARNWRASGTLDGIPGLGRLGQATSASASLTGSGMAEKTASGS